MPEEYPRPLDPPANWTGPLRAGLLGSGIEGSLSPVIHGVAASHHGISCDFQLYDHPAGTNLSPLLKRLHDEGLRGLSVTMPFKQQLDQHLVGMSPAAISIGAVNLLVRSEHGWVGDNTDHSGFLAPLARRRLAFERPLLMGCGGAARAAAHVLASMPFVSEVLLLCRNQQAARALKEEFDTPEKPWLLLDPASTIHPRADLLINATPLGMQDGDELPCPADWLDEHSVAYDMVYRPRQTRWLKEAEARGAGVIQGIEMLVEQARPAFKAWTGLELPVSQVMEALK